MPAPDLNTVPHYYHGYIAHVTAKDAHEATSNHLFELMDALQDASDEEWSYAYAPGKWTLKEVVQHIIDAERIFSHRALSIARGDSKPLPGFDEEAYASVSAANSRKSTAFLQELKSLGASTSCLFSSFGDQQLGAVGIANGLPISVNAIAYIVAGHAMHHTQIIRKRYLDKSYKHEDVAA